MDNHGYERTLASRMLEWLGSRDMSARTAAALAGVSESAMYDCINCKSGLQLRTLYKLCSTHGISADWLLGLEEC